MSEPVRIVVQGSVELHAPGVKITAQNLRVEAEPGTPLAKALTPSTEKPALPQKARGK